MAKDEYSAREFKVVGTRPRRPDGIDKVTGKARYGADMTAPGMLWGAILRSPHAHARIVSIDTSKAAALPGVKAAITRADFPQVEVSPDMADILDPLAQLSQRRTKPRFPFRPQPDDTDVDH